MLNKRTILSYLPSILTGAEIAGVMITTALAIKAAPKAGSFMDGPKPMEKEDKKEVLHIYTPTLISAGLTITAIIGNELLNNRQKFALIGAAGLLYDKSKAQAAVLHNNNMAVRQSTVETSKYGGDEIFAEEFSGRTFRTSMEVVKSAEYEFNRILQKKGHANLNTLFELLGISTTPWGELITWDLKDKNDWIEFNHIKIKDEGNQECILIQHTPWGALVE